MILWDGVRVSHNGNQRTCVWQKKKKWKEKRNEDRWRSKTVRLLFEVHVSVDLSKSTPQTSCTQISNLRCMSAVIGNVLLHIAVTLKRQIVTWLLMPSPSPLPPCYLHFNQKGLGKMRINVRWPFVLSGPVMAYCYFHLNKYYSCLSC